jgi:hypothetical protein
MQKDQETNKPDGNDFQYRVKKVLTDAGWNARMSPYYNDSFSEKPREIDIIAEKIFPPVPNSLYNSTVVVRLFIECKYIVKQTTFWLEERSTEKAKKIVDSSRAFHEVLKNYEVQANHHYLSNDLIAKLYRTEGKNPDGDPIFKAITQCLNATIYYRNHPTDLKIKYNHGRQRIGELNYSIIVCNSFEKFFKKDTTADSVAAPVLESFQLEVDYAYTKKDSPQEELFYIDVLRIDDLKIFEDEVLLKEIGLAKQKISDDEREAEFNRMRSRNEHRDPFDGF